MVDNVDNANSPNEDGRRFRLKVLTPMQVVYDKPVDMVVARTSDGDMGVLHNHDTRSALLGDGVLRIFEDKRREEELLMVLGGIFTVRGNEVTVLSEIAERPERMQEFLQELEAQRVASEIVEQETELYTKRVEMALRRALVYMDSDTPPL